jgi:hypothetical protein
MRAIRRLEAVAVVIRPPVAALRVPAASFAVVGYRFYVV